MCVSTNRRRTPALATLALAVALSLHSHANSGTVSEQLLQSYFDTAGVCTTSSVESIVETAGNVTVSISIEPATKKALLTRSNKHRDDWFSLHCPPQIHGIWQQANPPNDVLVFAQLSNSVQHTLSCHSYLHDRMQVPATLQARILRELEALFDR